MVTNDSLSPKKSLAVLSLASGFTQVEAASAANVSESTLVRWTKDAEFQASVRATQSQIFNMAIGRLVAGVCLAADALTEIAGNPQAKDSARVTAACKILEMVKDKVELAAIEERIRRLEDAPNS